MKKEIQERINAVRSGSIPKGYKKVRHMLFPDDWGEPVALNTVLTENKERNEELKFDKDDVLSVSGEHGVVNQIELLGRSYAGESVEPYHVVNTGDIVYTKSPLKQNPHGIIKMNKGKPGIVSTLYAVYHCNNPTTAQYLENYFCVDSYLNNYLKPLVKRGAKNDMKVNNEEVLVGVIPLPSFEEQKKINIAISKFDEIIALKKDLIKSKEDKKDHLSQILLNPCSGVRLPGFTDQWEEHTIGELGNAYSGIVGKSIEDFGKGSPYIPYTNIFSNCIVDCNSFEYVEIRENELQNKVKYGDMFFTTSSETPREVGMSSVYLGEDMTLYLNSFCFGFRFNTFSIIRPEFAAYYFRSDYIRRILYRLAQGSTRYNLPINDFFNEKICIPPSTEEQMEIYNILSSCDKEIKLLNKELLEWKRKKQQFVQLALTGIVRV